MIMLNLLKTIYTYFTLSHKHLPFLRTVKGKAGKVPLLGTQLKSLPTHYIHIFFDQLGEKMKIEIKRMDQVHLSVKGSSSQ